MQSDTARSPVASDEIRTWAITEIGEQGERKLTTLGIGNGNIFLANISTNTVQKWQTKDLRSAVSVQGMHVRLDIAGLTPTTLHFYVGSYVDDIIEKLDFSKSLATTRSRSQSNTPLPDVSKEENVAEEEKDG